MLLGIIDFIKPETTNFLVDIIVWFVKITSSVAWGIVLFTVALKLITLPFDIFSKISMRKNSLKMEEMRPELEKLQKQYADDKQLYNQKMMALYKKNGYSMFGACLPTILMLVIFIVAINAFNNYSAYQNLTYLYEMSNSYNEVVYEGVEVDESENPYVYKLANGKTTIDINKVLDEMGANDTFVFTIDPVGDATTSTLTVTKGSSENGNYVEYFTENGYVKVKSFYTTNAETGKSKVGTTEFSANLDALLVNDTLVNAQGKKFIEVYDTVEKQTGENAVKFITGIRQEASAKTFRQEKTKFLWVKNIWVADSPTAHPIESDWETFKTKQGLERKKNKDTATSAKLTQEEYSSLIAKLNTEKEEPNGYFILAILTAGISFLMQFVTSKSQKAQMELQTVDGQGAKSQKLMMWMMPIMMAVFAFMYTAAFSIYMILSSAISIVSTLGINWLVDKKFNGKKKKGEKEVVRGRVRDEEPAPVPEKKKKEEQPTQGDFITGPVKQKTHIRGRLK